MKVKVSDLLEGDKSFDIIAGQYYKIGTGRIYLEDDIVKVDYEFYSYYDINGIETAKVGIYKDLNSMMKDGKLLGNGHLVKNENVTINDAYAYIRLHFDVSIPEYSYDYMEKIENIDTVCGVRDISGTNIITLLPLFITSSIIFLITLVLPLPVTPCKSAPRGSFVS